jgi:hypothetical protein
MRTDLEEMELKERVCSFFDVNEDKDFKEQELWDALEIDTEAKNEEKVLSISRHTGVLRKVISFPASSATQSLCLRLLPLHQPQHPALN